MNDTIQTLQNDINALWVLVNELLADKYKKDSLPSYISKVKAESTVEAIAQKAALAEEQEKRLTLETAKAEFLEYTQSHCWSLVYLDAKEQKATLKKYWKNLCLEFDLPANTALPEFRLEPLTLDSALERREELKRSVANTNKTYLKSTIKHNEKQILDITHLSKSELANDIKNLKKRTDIGANELEVMIQRTTISRERSTNDRIWQCKSQIDSAKQQLVQLSQKEVELKSLSKLIAELARAEI